MSSQGKTAIVIGSTGAVGSQVLSLLRDSTPAYTQIHSFVRRPSSSTPSERVTEHVIDYEKLVANDTSEVSKLSSLKADTVFITLGTTRKDAGSAEKFQRIDRDYVVKSAEAARNQEVNGQQVVYCSAQAANPSSWFLYPRSKGETEQSLSALKYPITTHYRPGFLLNAQRNKPRPLEKYFGYFTHYVLSKISDSAEIDVKDLAKVMIHNSLHDPQNKVVANAEVVKLVRKLNQQEQQS
ncbi:unnamed protein product [Sympodiomycopsis kandeliae]